MSDTTRITAGEFHARCLELLDEVVESGEEPIITERGRPVARLVPIPAGPDELFDALRDSVLHEDDIVAPPEEPWDAMR